MRIEHFEDVEIWKEARRLTYEIYHLASSAKFKDFALRDQIRRAAVSVMSNIAEGLNEAGIQNLFNFFTLQKDPVGKRAHSSMSQSIKDILRRTNQQSFKPRSNVCRAWSSA